MFYLAKIIQAFGVADVGYGLFIGLTQPDGFGREMQLMVVGAAIFYFGRFLERRASA